MSKKLFHVELICAADVLHELLAAAARLRAGNVKIEPVLGEQEAAGNDARRKPADILFPWLRERSRFTAVEAVEFGASKGLSRSSVYGLLARLCRSDQARRTGPGEFRLLAAGEKAAAQYKGNGAAPPAPPAPQPSGELTHRGRIVQWAKAAGGAISGADIRKRYRAEGLTVKNIDSALWNLRKDKLIVSKKPGLYALTEKGNA